MANKKISAAHWNAANPSLYHLPWTSDKQNRFFSLTPQGGGKEYTFTVKFLGRPDNVSFKAGHRLDASKEMCLCVSFPEEQGDNDRVFRLVHPNRFVLLQAFEGYEPIDEKIIKKEQKAPGNTTNNSWYKKVWNMYCKAKEPEEYKQPVPPSYVLRAVPEPEQSKSDEGRALSNSEDSGDDAGSEKSETESKKKSKKSKQSPVPKEVGDDLMTLFFGGIDDLPEDATLATCTKVVRRRLKNEFIDDKVTQKQDEKQKKHEQERQEARDRGDHVDEDGEFASDCTECSFDADTDFDDKVEEEGKKLYAEYQAFQSSQPAKKPSRSHSSGSTSSGSGKYELCCSFVFVFVL